MHVRCWQPDLAACYRPPHQGACCATPCNASLCDHSLAWAIVSHDGPLDRARLPDSCLQTRITYAHTLRQHHKERYITTKIAVWQTELGHLADDGTALSGTLMG